MERLKRVLAIHDLSGFGKCSLTVALPVISVAGIECTCMPTAILSTHTGGFTGYTFKDLSEDLYPMAKHWESLGLEFDAIYIGYLGSSSQARSVENIITLLKDDKTLVIIDPVMADNGEYYTGLDEEMCKGFLSICEFADIITPNFTEATLLLGEKYIEPPYTNEYVEGLLKRLSDLGPSKVVLTGVSFKEGEVGAASYDRVTDEINYAFTKRTPGSYHGTGDLFGSAFVAAMVRGININKSIKIAVDLVKASIDITYKRGTPSNYGVDFESKLQQFSIDIQNNINK